MEASLWIKENLHLNPKSSTRLTELYSAYQAQLASQGKVCISNRAFAKQLRTFLKPFEDTNQVAIVNRSGLVVVGASYKT